MTEITIKHVIDASPALVDLLKGLTDALLRERAIAVVNYPTTSDEIPTMPEPDEIPVTPERPAAKKSVETAAPANPIPTSELVPTPEPTPAPSTPSVPTDSPTPSAPTTASSTPTTPTEPAEPKEKVYTFKDISAAGSELLAENKIGPLMDLLKANGVQAVTQLKPEQYTAVAEGLRKLGAHI
jgi:hypothetical protein